MIRAGKGQAHMLLRIFCIGMVGLAATPLNATAAPKGAYDACIRKLCTSTRQSDCWVKDGAAICDREQNLCKDLAEHAPAKVLRRVGDRWEVQTAYGRGYVSDQMMMLDGRACPALLD